MPNRSKLEGIGVLVTRPAHQAGPLCERIEAAGGRAVRFPLLTIHDSGDTPQVNALLAQLGDYHIAIFVSPNAVHFGLDAIERHGGLPEQLQLAAVGQGSARELQRRTGHPPDLVPTERFDSEGLLALQGLQQVAGKRILILRGNGGRELLAQTLRERGARVDYAEVYRRERPSAAAAEPDWLEKTDIITLTSGEALENLVALTPAAEQSMLLSKPLVVVSDRTTARAQALGFRHAARVAARADDDAILEAVVELAAALAKTE